MICGIDVSTKAIDCVWLNEDSDAATWRRYELRGADPWERCRSIAAVFPGPTDVVWDDTLAIGLEVAHGFSSGAVNRCVGAVLARLPASLLVQPWIPSAWRKAIGMKGNASKQDAIAFAIHRMTGEPSQYAHGAIAEFNTDETVRRVWTEDAHEAYCIALATRQLVQHAEAA